MFIQIEPMPDMSSLKFYPGKEVYVSGTIQFSNREEAVTSPLAQRLFDVPGVAALSFGHDFITVTKNSGDWQHLKPALLGTIMEHFMLNAPVIHPERLSPSASRSGIEAGGAGTLADQVMTSLREVIDPELGYNIVDLGLIYDVAVDADGSTTVTMTTTTPGCPATSYLKQGVQERAEAIEGIKQAEVELTYAPRWSPEMMSAAAKLNFGVV